jgi:hypothetical protein
MAHPRRTSVKSAVAFVACCCALVLVAGGGCEVAIGDTIPDFACAGPYEPCPDGQVCDPDRRQCVPSCITNSSICRGLTQCAMGGQSMGLCVGVDASVVPTDGSAPEASTGETSVIDSNSPADTSVGGDTVVPPPDSSDSGCTGALCACAGDSQCASGVCAGVLDVGIGLYDAAGKTDFCTTPCCTSADCAAGLVCYATSTSASEGSYCVAPQWLQRSTTLGTGMGGQSCTANTECRSGLCDPTSGTCADTCCSTKQSSTECAPGLSCGFGNFPGVAAFDKNFTPLCGSFGNTPNGGNCNASSDCQGGLCTASGGPFGGGSCQDPCRSSSDCAGQNYSCSIAHLQGSGVYGLCFPYQGGNADGTACHANADCQSNFCNGASICSNICFANTDCPAGLYCRPEYVMSLSRGGGAASVLSCGM